MRALVRRQVEVAVPAEQLWDYVTDWRRQGEWMPQTRVEPVDDGDPAHEVGGRFRAWSGLGRVGFWDDMTITTWERTSDGGGVCEVLHTGKVVRGEGVFEVRATGPASSRFLWQEMAVVPLGRLGATGWGVLGRPALERFVDLGLRRLKARLELAAVS
jgi:hypothetical protein